MELESHVPMHGSCASRSSPRKCATSGRSKKTDRQDCTAEKPVFRCFNQCLSLQHNNTRYSHTNTLSVTHTLTHIITHSHQSIRFPFAIHSTTHDIVACIILSPTLSHMPSSAPLGLTEFDSTNNSNHKEDFSPLQLSVPQSHLLHSSRKSTHQSSHSLLSPSPNMLQTPNVFKVPQDRDSPRPAFGSTEFDPCTSAKTRGPAEPATLWSLVAPSPTTFALSPGLWSASPKLLSPLSATFPKFKSEGAGMFGETQQRHSNDSSIAAEGGSVSGHTDLHSAATDSNGAVMSGSSAMHGGAQDHQHSPHHHSTLNPAAHKSHSSSQKKSSTQRSTSSTQAASCDTPTLKNIQMKMQQQKEQYRNNMNRNGVVAQSVESVYNNMSQFQQQQNMRQQAQAPGADQAQYTQHLARLCAQLSQHQDPQQMMNVLTQPAQNGAFPEPKQTDVQFHIKPARKNMDSFVSNTPRDLYSQPYKYDIRIVIPAHIRDHYVLKMQLCVEKTKQYISKNHKNESTLIIERVIEKEHKGEAIFNYRVVFNACSFHFSKSLFSLHLFLVPKVRVNADQQDSTNTNAAQLDTSGYEPVWRSIPFEMYARKVNPRQWPSEQEIQERFSTYISDQTRSAQNFLGTPFAMAAQQLTALQQGAADPAHLTQLVSSAIQHRQQQQIQQQLAASHFVSPGAPRPQQMGNPQQMQQHMMASGYFPQQHANSSPPMHYHSQSQQSGESLSDSEDSPHRKNKRKRNLQIDTQFSKRQKTGNGTEAMHM